jgi:hypothetical protein
MRLVVSEILRPRGRRFGDSWPFGILLPIWDYVSNIASRGSACNSAPALTQATKGVPMAQANTDNSTRSSIDWPLRPGP